MIFLMIFLMIFSINFVCENPNFLYENLRFCLWKILRMLSMIFSMIHKMSGYNVRVSKGVKLAGWGGSFSMVCRNNAGRLGAGFISVCLETRWLGQKCGFYVPEWPCTCIFYSTFQKLCVRHVGAEWRARSQDELSISTTQDVDSLQVLTIALSCLHAFK